MMKTRARRRMKGRKARRARKAPAPKKAHQKRRAQTTRMMWATTMRMKRLRLRFRDLRQRPGVTTSWMRRPRAATRGAHGWSAC
jgi:hypothetical protein